MKKKQLQIGLAVMWAALFISTALLVEKDVFQKFFIAYLGLWVAIHVLVERYVQPHAEASDKCCKPFFRQKNTNASSNQVL